MAIKVPQLNSPVKILNSNNKVKSPGVHFQRCSKCGRDLPAPCCFLAGRYTREYGQRSRTHLHVTMRFPKFSH